VIFGNGVPVSVLIYYSQLNGLTDRVSPSDAGPLLYHRAEQLFPASIQTSLTVVLLSTLSTSNSVPITHLEATVLDESLNWSCGLVQMCIRNSCEGADGSATTLVVWSITTSSAVLAKEIWAMEKSGEGASRHGGDIGA